MASPRAVSTVTTTCTYARMCFWEAYCQRGPWFAGTSRSCREKKWYVGLTVRRSRPAFLYRAAIEMSRKEREPDGVLQAKDDQRPEPGYRHGHGAPAASVLSQDEAGWTVVCGRRSSCCEHDCSADIRTPSGYFSPAFSPAG